MTNRRWRRAVLGILLATLVVALPVASEAKKKPSTKRVVEATVAGKHVKWSGRYLSFNYGASGLTIIGTKVRATKTIGVGCPILLDAVTYPVTFETNCSGQYAEHAGKRYWFNTGSGPPLQPSFQVTFDSFDGTVVAGHFSGTLPALIGATTPVDIEGTFRGPLNK